MRYLINPLAYRDLKQQSYKLYKDAGRVIDTDVKSKNHMLALLIFLNIFHEDEKY